MHPRTYLRITIKVVKSQMNCLRKCANPGLLPIRHFFLLLPLTPTRKNSTPGLRDFSQRVLPRPATHKALFPRRFFSLVGRGCII